MREPRPASAQAPRPSRRLRAPRGLGVAILCVALAALALSAAAIYRRAVVERLITRVLDLAEIELGAITVEAFEPTHITLRDLEILHPVSLSIERLKASYSWSSLAAERFESLEAHGIQLRTTPAGEVAPSQPSAPAESAAASPLPAEAAVSNFEELLAALRALSPLPARRIDLTDLRIEIAGAEDTYRIEGELRATESDEGFEARARLGLREPLEFATGVSIPRAIDLDVGLEIERGEIRIALLPAVLQIEIRGDKPLLIEAETPAIDARVATSTGDSPPRIEVESSGGRVSIPDYEFEARGIAFSTAFTANGLPFDLDLRVSNVGDLRHPTRIAPLTLSASVELDLDRPRFRLVIRDRDTRAELSLHGHHDVSKDRGSADFYLKPLSFEEEGLQPADLSQTLTGWISNATGSLEALGTMSWAGVMGDDDTSFELRGSIDIALRDLALTTPLSRLEGLNSVIRLDGPWPPSTSPGQLLQIGLIDVGVGVTDATASFQLHPDQSLNLEEAAMHFAGGTFRTSGLLDLEAPEQALTLEVSGVELETLFALLDLEGLTGEGILSGAIPIVRTSDAIEIREGELSNRSIDDPARKPGWIRYRPDTAVATAASGRSEFGVALEALENFHYQELDIELSGSPSGIVEISLHLAGSNPDFHDGHPLNLNLNLESPLGSLLEGATYTEDVIGGIERKLSAFGSRAANFRDADTSTTGVHPVAPMGADR